MENMRLQEKLAGKAIVKDSPLFEEIHKIKAENEPLAMELNTHYRTNQELLEILGKMTHEKIDSSVTISQPFYTDFGRHISFGKDIFINQAVMFVDLGGITINDNVLIGPGARLITVNHLLEPEQRRGLSVSPIILQKNAWIGANATILPGITIGENSVVAADATVTRDVPKNVIVAGSPAKVIRKIEI